MDNNQDNNQPQQQPPLSQQPDPNLQALPEDPAAAEAARQQAAAQAPAQQPGQQPQQGGQRLRIDDNMLHQIGLGQLPPHEKNRLLAQIYETLELRVGMTLANQMTDEQLKQFEGFIDSNDERGALTWLESNFPNYKQVVAQELEKLKAEIQQNSAAILDAVANQPAPAPNQQYPQQQPGPQQPQQPQQPPAGQYPPVQQPGQTYDPNQPPN